MSCNRFVLRWLAVGVLLAAPSVAAQRPYPILFVTQVPIPFDFVTIGAVFGNQHGDVASVGRGGDLYLLMPDGSLKNLTGLAGLGVASGFQGHDSIAVRDPSVSFDGSEALFSMVQGAPGPDEQYLWDTYYWQIYEVTNLGDVIASNATPVISKVANQPQGYDNITPIYGSDGRIVFTSDRPHNGAAHLFPQLDEYEEEPTVSGLWSMDPSIPGGDLKLLDHSPSGDFTPIVDSFGRIIFTRWDHLQRDQQADSDALNVENGQTPTYGTFNWSSEASASIPLNDRSEVFPEPRSERTDLLQPWEEGHSMNVFFPWMLDQDGSGMETVNHIGRHDLSTYFDRSFNDDDNLVEFICGNDVCGRANDHDLRNLLEMRELPTGPAGTYVGVDAPEFYTHAAGQLVALPAPPSANADTIVADWITHPDTKNFTDTPSACHSGLYRNPLGLSDGSLIAVYAGESSPGHPETREAANEGTRANPVARYKFRMVSLVDDGSCTPYKKHGATLTGSGIVKTLSYFDPDVLVSYSNVVMWELSPVEVRSRPVPPMPSEGLPAEETTILQNEGVDPSVLRQFLIDYNLALLVSRNVTTRDQADRQQPWQLKVDRSGGVQTPPVGQTSGTVYGIRYFQLLQGDLLRGLGGTVSPDLGRRVLAEPMHDGGPQPPPSSGSGPPGTVEIAADGSVAAFVPAHRALSWQTLDANGVPVVRERYWLTFQAGQMRSCGSCHGVNTSDQAGAPPPTNAPQALHQLLQYWKTWIFSDDFERGDVGRWSAAIP